MPPFKHRRLSATAMPSSSQTATATATSAHTQQQQPPSWFAEYQEQMRLFQLDRDNMSRQLQEIAGQVEQNKQDLKHLSRVFAVKHRSNIRVLKACGRRKMRELLQADLSAEYAKGWDQFLMSLTGSDCKTLEAQGFTQDALKATEL